MAHKPATDVDAATEAAPLVNIAARLDERRAHATSTPGLEPPDSQPPLVGGRYEILGMLGSGGMGTVYRARDRELDETVALKILKKELAASPGMLERFRREVKLARLVTHRNVARTFDIGEDGGDRFLTMELIDGEMLGALLARRGRVSLGETIVIARDVCAGLSAAHAAGVLHRDLKPENVIVARDGRAVITDFGIARAVVQGEVGRTGGGIIGTPAYMAPEQVEGSSDLDARADLYALGVMLYELLTGAAPWPGDSAFAIAAARLLRPPPDPRKLVPELPEVAAELVMKLMARQRDDRFASADATAEALSAIATAAQPGSARSIVPARMMSPTNVPHASRKKVAVLPLLNLGAEDDEYLAQTVTEDLVDLLSMVRDLRVRPRGDTTRFNTAARDVRDAGRQLDVDVVVDGSLRRLGEMVRVSVRLVTVEDGFQLWAQRFDRPAAQVLTVADDGAAAVAHALAAEVTLESRPAAIDAVAQELYLRGRYLLNRSWFSVSREGLTLLKEAHLRAPSDPRIAATYALATARILAQHMDTFEEMAAARALAEQTLASHPMQPEAWLALGNIYLNEGDATMAAVRLERALALAPSSVEALDVVGRMLVEVGRTQRGIEALRRALAIDPGMVYARHTLARCFALLGDLDGAEEVLGPPPAGPTDFIADAFMRGRFALWNRDRATCAALLRMVDERNLRSAGDIRAFLLVGAEGRATPEVEEAIEKTIPDNARFPIRRRAFQAQIRAETRLTIGDVAGALKELRLAESLCLIDVMWLDRCKLLDGLREHSEFLAVRESTEGRAREVAALLDRHE